MLTLLLATALQAQTQAPTPNSPTAKFESQVREVVVDVVVTANKGEPLSGLRQTDFSVYEDGKPQTVTSFKEHKGIEATPLKLPAMPRNVFTNFPPVAPADSVNVLLVDTLNTPTADQVFVHQQMLKYLKTIPPGARLAVFTLTSQLRMIQEFTTDSSSLLAALNDPSIALPHKSPLLQSDAEQAAYDRMSGNAEAQQLKPLSQDALQMDLSLEGVNPVIGLRQFLAESTVRIAEARIALSIQAMQHLARYLSAFPGRKNVIWLSGSFPISFNPDVYLNNPFGVTRSYQNDLRKTAALLTLANVAIYPVAAEGLAADSLYQANANEVQWHSSGAVNAQRQMQSLNAGIGRHASAQLTMEELAKSTGGQAFYNTNGLGDIVTRVTTDGMRYYTITYRPTNAKTDGKYRRISVEVAAEKCKLAYRRGYFATEDATRSSEHDPRLDSDLLLPLMGFAVPDISQIVYKIRVMPTDPQPAPGAPRAGANTELKGPTTRYDIDFAVAVDDLVFELDREGTRSARFDVRLMVYDSAGKPLNMLGRRREIKLDPKAYADARKVGLQLRAQIDVPTRGDNHLRVGIYDLYSGKAGTLGIRMRPAIAAKAN